jgi:fructose/tagatose bisphosphate aldolase
MALKNIDLLVPDLLFGDETAKKAGYRLIRERARERGLGPTSVFDLYQARGRGEIGGFTVPAINLRGFTYESARAAIRAAKKLRVAAVIFEIARSEMGYTDQSPAEYSAVILAAAIKENYNYPVFIQGDHFQVKEKGFKENREKEISGIKKLIADSLAAGFYQIDLDTSTLVELDKATIKEQQKNNYATAAELTDFIRQIQPAGINVALGGEIGEIGGKNSTSDELHAYLRGYQETVKSAPGLSKIAVQTGTVHGGVPMPDGTIAKVKLDFETLQKLSEIARREYGLAGCVQHGASTLPSELFDKFPGLGTAEIHLATEFQNMVFDHREFPKDLLERIHRYCQENLSGERKEGETEQQFFYKTRKKAWGPFKKDINSIAANIKEAIAADLEKKFLFLFEKLGVKDSAAIVKKYVKVIKTPIAPGPTGAGTEKFSGAD